MQFHHQMPVREQRDLSGSNMHEILQAKILQMHAYVIEKQQTCSKELVNTDQRDTPLRNTALKCTSKRYCSMCTSESSTSKA